MTDTHLVGYQLIYDSSSQNNCLHIYMCLHVPARYRASSPAPRLLTMLFLSTYMVRDFSNAGLV
jgi:hypothetical protein